VVASHEDITERKEAEQKLEQRDQQLQRIGRIGLLQELVSGLGHELKQPLTAIHNYAEGVLGQLADSNPSDQNLLRIREGVTQMYKQAGRAGRIIDQMREFVRTTEPQWELLRVDRLIEEVLELVNPRAIESNVSVQVNVERHLPKLMAQGIAMQQVLLNLITNSIQAIENNDPAAPRVIRIDARQTDNGQLELTIADSGPVVDPEAVANMFYPFHSSKEAGLGIGLNICETIIARHEGRLWAEPNPQRGISMHMHLPFAPTLPSTEQ
jgi:C4-dicarboxylate-specific signal transduction histidine kinase